MPTQPGLATGRSTQLPSLEAYRDIVSSGTMDRLQQAADKVRPWTLQHVNSTAVGGGVAEILTRMLPMLKELGIQASWDVIDGNSEFFEATKAFTTPCTDRPAARPSECSTPFAKPPTATDASSRSRATSYSFTTRSPWASSITAATTTGSGCGGVTSTCRPRAGRPGRSGKRGRVRSRACTWLFSSTLSTSARSGGWRDRPTISRTFSTNWGQPTA